MAVSLSTFLLSLALTGRALAGFAPQESLPWIQGHGWEISFSLGIDGISLVLVLLTTLAAAGFFVGSFALVPLLPTGFIPPDDLSQTQVYLSLPPGSTCGKTCA